MEDGISIVFEIEDVLEGFVPGGGVSEALGCKEARVLFVLIKAF